MRIIALPEVEEYLTDLINILYEKKYFSFEENAIKYVQDLIEDIRANLPNKIKKPAPAYFERYGHNMPYSAKINSPNGMFFSRYTGIKTRSFI